jgi:hypothetical protein
MAKDSLIEHKEVAIKCEEMDEKDMGTKLSWMPITLPKQKCKPRKLMRCAVTIRR